jgi:Flp pilus assembly protein TadD
LEEAERVARKATATAPERYEVWSTLALILALGDKLDAAESALARSHALNTTDSRLFLVDGQIAVKRGDLPAAEKALAAVGSDRALSVADRRELQALSIDIARLRRLN